MTFLPSRSHSNGAAILDNHMSIQAAAEHSGYNEQYLRRLVRAGVIQGVKIGQMWLVVADSLDAYIKSIQEEQDRRFGPRVYHQHIQQQE